MQSARLDRKITIEKPTETLNAVREVVATWSTFASVWAKKTDTGGSEKFSGAVIAEFTVNFEIRYLSGITMKMRIKYEDEYYNIVNMVEIGRRDGLLLKTLKQDAGYNT